MWSCWNVSVTSPTDSHVVRPPKLSVNNTVKWNQNVCMTNVYTGGCPWQCVLFSLVVECVSMSYHVCVCRWPHVAVCVAFVSIQMCGDVLSQMCTQATTCSNMCFYEYSNVYWCYIFVALHEAIMYAVFSKSKCVEMLYLVALHCVIIDAVLPVYNCVLMSYLVALHWSNHVCCFSSVQRCGDIISWCITLKQSCVLFFQSPNVWWCHILLCCIE